MSSGREKEFDQYARECVRLAEGVEDPDLREKLLRQAREWMQAEMDEEDGAISRVRFGSQTRVCRHRRSLGGSCRTIGLAGPAANKLDGPTATGYITRLVI
jgi:hypothetical protein